MPKEQYFVTYSDQLTVTYELIMVKYQQIEKFFIICSVFE